MIHQFSGSLFQNKIAVGADEIEFRDPKVQKRESPQSTPGNWESMVEWSPGTLLIA